MICLILEFSIKKCAYVSHILQYQLSQLTREIFWFSGCLLFCLYLNWFKTNLVREEKCWLLGSPRPQKKLIWYSCFLHPHKQPCSLSHPFFHHRNHHVHLYDLPENRHWVGIGLPYKMESETHQQSELPWLKVQILCTRRRYAQNPLKP